MAKITNSVSTKVLDYLLRYMALGYSINMHDWYNYMEYKVRVDNIYTIQDMRKGYYTYIKERKAAYLDDISVVIDIKNPSDIDSSEIFHIVNDKDSMVMNVDTFSKVKLELAEGYNIYLIYTVYAPSEQSDYVCEFVGFLINIDELDKNLLREYTLNIELDEKDNNVLLLVSSNKNTILLDEPLYINIVRGNNVYEKCLYNVDKLFV